MDKSDCQRSVLNPKFRRLKGEFVYEGIPWVSWTTEDLIKRVEDKFKFVESDIVLASYPKSGVTWLSEIIRLLLETSGKKDHLNFALENVKKTYLHERVLFLEENWKHKYPGQDGEELAINYLEDMLASPTVQTQCRLIKTHLPYRILKKALDRCVMDKPKIIYILRNPKDTAVSMYHFYKGCTDYGPFEGDWKEFLQMWLDGWIAAGDWREVIPEWIEAICRSHENESDERIHLITYEDLHSKPHCVLQRLYKFLYPESKAELHEDVVQCIVQHTCFQAMKTNVMVNYEDIDGFNPEYHFMRKGKVGDWKNHFTRKENDQFEDAYAECIQCANRILSKLDTNITFE